MADDFEKIFGERLGALEGKPAEGQWQKISNRLQKDRWRERWLLVAVLLPLFLSMPAIILIKNTAEQKRSIENSITNQENVSKDNLHVDPKVRSNLTDESKDLELASRAYEPLISSDMNSQGYFSAGLSFENETENHIIDPIEPKKILHFNLLQPTNQQLRTVTVNSGAGDIIAPDRKERSRKNFSIILSMHPNLNYGIFKPDCCDEIQINNFDQNDRERLGINLALGLAYHLNPRISVELQGSYRYHQQQIGYQYRDYSSGNYQAVVHENSLLITPEVDSRSDRVFEDFSGFGVDFGILYHLNTTQLSSQSLVAGLSVFNENASNHYFMNLGYRFNFPVSKRNSINLQPQLSYSLTSKAGNLHFSQRNYNVGVKLTFDHFLRKN